MNLLADRSSVRQDLFSYRRFEDLFSVWVIHAERSWMNERDLLDPTRRWRHRAFVPAIGSDGCRDPDLSRKLGENKTGNFGEGERELQILDLGRGRLVIGRLILGFLALLDHFAKRAGMLTIEGFTQALTQGARLHRISHRHADPGR